MENITEDAKRIMNIGNQNGVLIAEVLPQSTALAAGFKKGDILVSIGDKTVNSTQEVFSALANYTSGSEFSYDILRNKKHIKGKSVFRGYPEEKYPDLDVVYSESKSGIGLQRMIITKPKKTNKRLPVVAFIGGIGCYSLDFPMDTNRSEVQLMNTISRAGFLSVRLEKPGMGDNAKYCKPCNEVSFSEETEGYIQMIRTLKARNDVDSNAIFLIGHSMGGVFAPMISSKTNVKGIVSYGTIGSSFIEYLAKTRRTIAEAYNMNPEETDELIKDFCECSGYYFVEKMNTAQAAEKKEVCKEFLSIFDLRSRKYNDELYSYNIPGLWKTFNGKALIIWGESDYISSKEDHMIIADAINYYHKGNAEFLTVKNSDHGMNIAASFQEAQKNQGPYNREVASAILDWLNKS
jgi:pimeloyl-ACP methyl ester carboxylesterase